MIGAIVGAATGLASSIYGGIASARAARKQKNEIARQKEANKAWYERRYNEDATQRGDAQRLLTKTREAYEKRNREAAATQAVVGGSDESVAATREANAKGLADTASQINAASEARKDSVEESYRNQDQQLAGQLSALEAQRSANIANATSQAIGAAAQLGSAIDGSVEDKKAKKEEAAKAAQAKAAAEAKTSGSALNAQVVQQQQPQQWLSPLEPTQAAEPIKLNEFHGDNRERPDNWWDMSLFDNAKRAQNATF